MSVTSSWRKLALHEADLDDDGHDTTGGGGAPDDATYLTTTAQAGLSAEIVVGATPGGELGGTWASPTVDATHSGSAHHVEDHDHDGSPTQQLLGANTHQTPDTDAATSSLHHTIGASATQSAAGNHTHTAGDSAKASGSGDVTTTSSLADVTGVTLSLAAGTYIVIGHFDVLVNNALNDRTFEGHLDVGTVDENDYAQLNAPGLVNVRATLSQVWRVVLGSTTTVKLRTQHSGGTVGDFTVKSTNTTIAAWTAGGASSSPTWISDNYQPQAYPGSPNAVDDEFEGGGAIDAKWTKTNDPAGADAIDQTTYAGYMRLGLVEGVTDNVANYVLLTQTAPTGTATARYRIRAAIGIGGLATDDGEFAHITACLIDTVNGIAVGAGAQVNNATVTHVITPTAQLDAAGTPGNMTTIKTTTVRIGPGEFFYAELRKTTTAAYTSANTYEAWLSIDGIVWWQVGTCSATFTATPVLGLSIRRPKAQTGTPNGEIAVDFFRKVA